MGRRKLEGMRTWAGEASSDLPIDEALANAIEAIERQPYEPHPCKLGRHLISPRPKPGEMTRCTLCGMPVQVPARAA